MIKRLTVLLSIVAFGLASLNSFVILPINYNIINNIVYNLTVLPLVLQFLSSVTELIVFWCALAILIYGISVMGLRKSRPLIVTYGLAIVYKHLINFVLDCFRFGALQLSLLSSVSFNVIMEVLIATVVIVLSHKFAKENSRLGDRQRVHLFPFRKILDTDNPIQRAALAATLTITIPRIVSRIIFDIAVGFPTSIPDLLWMIVYYLLDIVTGVVGYLVMVYVIMSIEQKHRKLREFGELDKV